MSKLRKLIEKDKIHDKMGDYLYDFETQIRNPLLQLTYTLKSIRPALDKPDSFDPFNYEPDNDDLNEYSHETLESEIKCTHCDKVYDNEIKWLLDHENLLNNFIHNNMETEYAYELTD